jgi:hypothetical protein
MNYSKAVEVETLKENARAVLQSIEGLTPEDAMTALAACVSHVVIEKWPTEVRRDLLDAWFVMVRGSLVVAE